ncbi:MAG TPA: hypothetical protein VK864_02040 [Longimicrobiales bacterium]|nr:hypothetical protein [Longimicrobiales bacterium]
MHARVSTTGTVDQVRRWRGIVLLLVFAGCGCDPDNPTGPDPDALFTPTSAALLTASSPTGDEDPTVVRARDGAIYLAWFSNRGNNPDIYITHTARGTQWTAPVRVTTSPAGDFAPSLYQDEQGRFHLAWFRWTALNSGHIWYNSSADGQTWNANDEVRVTSEINVDDWVPTLTQAPNGTLLIYFVSALRDPSGRSDLWFTQKPPSATSWSPAARVPVINSASEHDHLPFVARTGNHLTLVWERHDSTQALPWLNPKSRIYFATSGDGTAWSAPVQITQDAGAVVNLFPGLYQRFDGSWTINWLSTRAGGTRLFELPLANAANFPTGLSENTMLPGAAYSHRITQTSTPGIYIGVWVQGPDGAQDIYYRFFER